MRVALHAVLYFVLLESASALATLAARYPNATISTAVTSTTTIMETTTGSTIYETFDVVDVSTPATTTTGSTIYETFDVVDVSTQATTPSPASTSTIYETLEVVPVNNATSTAAATTITSSASYQFSFTLGATGYTPVTTEILVLTSYDDYNDDGIPSITIVFTTTETLVRFPYTQTVVLPETTYVEAFAEVYPLEVDVNVYTYPYLSTTVTETITAPENPNTQVPLDGYRCVDDGGSGEGCPGTAVGYGPLGAQEVSASIAACFATYNASDSSTVWQTATYNEVVTVSTGLSTSYWSSLFNPQPANASPCCGECELNFFSVEVFYFPPAGANSSCVPTAMPSTAPPSPISSAAARMKKRELGGGRESHPKVLQGRVHSEIGGSIAVDNGFTFTSPSIYVAFQSVYATNLCGTVGSAYSDITLAFAPGELYTLSGGQGQYELGWPAFTSLPFNPASLTCGDKPIIAVPPELESFDPNWATCYDNGWQGYDPPYALTPQNGPDAVLTPVSAPAETTPASPSLSPFSLLAPPRTKTPIELTPVTDPGAMFPTSSPLQIFESTSAVVPLAFQSSVLSAAPGTAQTKIPADPAVSADPGSSQSSPKPQNPAASSIPASPQDPAPSPNPTSPQDPAPSSSPAPLQDPAPSSNPAPSQNPQAPHPAPTIFKTFITVTTNSMVQTIPILTVENLPPSAAGTAADPSTGGLGGIIMSMFGNQPVQSTPAGQSTTPGQPPPAPSMNVPSGPWTGVATPISLSPVLSVGGDVATVINPSVIAINGATITAGAGPITVGGQAVSLGTAGGLIIGSHTAQLPPAQIAPPQVLATIGGQTIVAESSIIEVDGSTLVQGGATMTISNTLVYYGSAGLVIGSSTVLVPVAEPSLVAIGGGVTLTLGAPTTTIDGTPYYYGTSGLVVGTSTIPLPGQAPITTESSQSPASASAGHAVNGTARQPTITPFRSAGNGLRVGISSVVVVGVGTWIWLLVL